MDYQSSLLPTCSLSYRNQACVIDVRGEIDIATVDALRDALDTVSLTLRTYVDLTLTSYIDSSGLSLLLRRANAAPELFSVVLPAVHPLRRIFVIANLLDDLHVVDALPELP